MPAHLSLATAIDKNRIASQVVYLVLLEVDVRDPDTGAVLNTIHCTNNTEPYVFNGITYVNIPFTMNVVADKQTSPSATIDVFDLGQTFQAQLQAYGRSLDWPCRILIVNASNPTPSLELRYDFDITAATAKDDSYTMSFTLGAENPLTLRFPPRQQYRNRCFWKYRSAQCGYTGDLPTCSLQMNGDNGCRAHNNTLHYGGFPGIKTGVNSVT